MKIHSFLRGNIIICLIASLLLPQTAIAEPSVQAEPVNLALNKTVASSTNYGTEGWDRTFLVDGVRIGVNTVNGAKGWTSMPLSNPPVNPEWVVIDLGTAERIDKVVLWPRNDEGQHVGLGFPVDFTIQTSTDNATWTTVASHTNYPNPSDGGGQPFAFAPVSARYVKVEGTVLFKDDFNHYVMQLAEAEVYRAESVLSDQEAVEADHAALTLGDTSSVGYSIPLPKTGREGSAIRWTSSNTDYMNEEGRLLKRPPADGPDATLQLQAEVTKGAASLSKTFDITVRAHKPREPQTEDKFQIGIFWPPVWEHTNDAQYQAIKEANVDVIQNVIGSLLDTEERNLKMLDLAERHDLKLSVADPRVNGTDQDIADMVATYKDYWATFGYYIKDEPRIGQLVEAAGKYHKLLGLDPEKTPYVNLNPNIYGDIYENDYVREWVRKVGADRLRYLSYDNYPFGLNDTFNEHYYDNANIIRRVGLENDVKTASYLQSIGVVNGYRRPSPDDMRFSVYSYLAYGFKYVTWFTYWTPTNRSETFTNAIIDPDGNKTDLYEPFKQLNGEMKQLGKTLIHLDATEVYHSGSTTPPGDVERIPDNFFWQPVNGDDSIIVTYYNDKRISKPYVMVVNKSLKESKTLAFRLAPSVTSVAEISKQADELLPTNFNPGTGDISDTFLPGEGKLYALNDDLPPYVGPQEPVILPKSQTDVSPFSNLALNRPTKASSDVGNWGWSKQNAVDGQTVGGGSSNGWSSFPVKTHPSAPEWISIDLEQERDVKQVVLWPRSDGTNVGAGFPYDYNIQLSSDGIHWTTAAERTDAPVPETGEKIVLDFPPVKARYVKVEGSRLRLEPNGEYAMQLAEIEVYQQADSRLHLTPDAPHLLVGQRVQVEGGVWQDDQTLQPWSEASFRSANPRIAVIDDHGRITGISPGTTTISVTAATMDGKREQGSVEVTVARLEDGWNADFIGGADATIIADPTAGGYEIRATGLGCGANGDSLLYLNRKLHPGKRNEITAVIESVAMPDHPEGLNSRAGILYRKPDDKREPFASLSVSPDGRLTISYRAATGRAVETIKGDYVQFPVQLKFIKDGDKFTGYYMNRNGWTPVYLDAEHSSVAIRGTDTFKGGIAAYSGVNDLPNHVRISGITVR